MSSRCNIGINIAAIGCTLTINGPQTVGNGTTGTGGGVLTSGSDLAIHLNNTLVRDVVGTGPLSRRGAPGNMTGTGTYTSTTPITVHGE